jgi:hypothetical protein
MSKMARRGKKNTVSPDMVIDIHFCRRFSTLNGVWYIRSIFGDHIWTIFLLKQLPSQISRSRRRPPKVYPIFAEPCTRSCYALFGKRSCNLMLLFGTAMRPKRSVSCSMISMGNMRQGACTFTITWIQPLPSLANPGHHGVG